jgi:hypothetical protein
MMSRVRAMRGLVAEYARAIWATIVLRFQAVPVRLRATWVVMAVAVGVLVSFYAITVQDGSDSQGLGPPSWATPAAPGGASGSEEVAATGPTTAPGGARGGATTSSTRPSGGGAGDDGADHGAGAGDAGSGAGDLGASGGSSTADRAGHTGSSPSSDTTEIPATTPPTTGAPAPGSSTTTTAPPKGGSSGLLGGILDLLPTSP